MAVDLLGVATDRLRRSGSPSARLDAELLIGHALERDRAWVLAHPATALEPAQAAALEVALARRAAGEPIAYIRGYKEWFGLRIRTDTRALIPRPETELLASLAIDELATRLVRDERPIVAWEVGTGSGALSVALGDRFRSALALGRVALTASDLSPEALALAAENIAAHRLSDLVPLSEGDLLSGATGGEGIDVVIGNLPYLTSAEASSGFGSLAYEPRVALDGGADGLDLVRRLVHQLPSHLAPGGVALLEIGAGQAEAVTVEVAGLPMAATVSVTPDLAGIGRVVRIQRADDHG